jgi:D-alanyl-D-alanine carboxypeptidase
MRNINSSAVRRVAKRVLGIGILLSVQAAAQAAAADLDSRLDQAAKAIQQAVAATSMPGLVIGITDRHQLRKVILHGYADLKTHTPVDANSRFAVGSVSKAFTAIALMQLLDQGHFDPHVPITQYLPSLTIHSPFAPITGRDLMSHTAGLQDYMPDVASSRYAAIDLRDFVPTYAPGAHWWYSNTGFQLLGYVLENIDHEPYARAVRQRVLDPVGMSSTSAVIDDAERTRMVVSYTRWGYDGHYVEAPWFEYTAGDGGVVSNISDMCAYMRFYLNRGMGDRGRVLSESSFTALTTPILEDYGYGMWIRHENGDTVITHAGGIAGFVSLVEAHMDKGFGLVFLSNGGIEPALEKWIGQWVAAAFDGSPFPTSPAPQPPPVPQLQAFAGTYRVPGSAGGTLEFAVTGDHLSLQDGHGGATPLVRMGTDTFRAEGVATDGLPFFFGRKTAAGQDKAVEVSHGAQWYVTKDFSEEIRPAAPKEYQSFVGHFVNNGPEGPTVRVFVRNGRLMMTFAVTSEAPADTLEPAEPGVFRFGKAEYSPERARFDTVVDGQALRLILSGVPLYRKDIP